MARHRLDAEGRTETRRQTRPRSHVTAARPRTVLLLLVALLCAAWPPDAWAEGNALSAGHDARGLDAPSKLAGVRSGAVIGVQQQKESGSTATDITNLLTKGSKLVRQERWDEALPVMLEIAERRPSDALIARLLGDVYEKLTEREGPSAKGERLNAEAERWYRRALQNEPKTAEAAIGVGRAYLRRSYRPIPRDEKMRLNIAAEPWLVRAAELEPKNSRAAVSLGAVYADRRDWAKSVVEKRECNAAAERWYTKAIKLAPREHFSTAGIGLAIVQERRGDLVGAERWYVRVMEHNPKEAVAAHCLASVFERRRDHPRG